VDTTRYPEGSLANLIRANVGNLAKTGKVFLGWSTYDSSTTPSHTLYGMDQNTTVYAVWGTGTYYTISFNANGASGTAPAALYPCGSWDTYLDDPINLSKPGYRFYGWNTKADGSGKSYSYYASVNNDTTLYAIWEKIIGEKYPLKTATRSQIGLPATITPPLRLTFE
jgi:uncharacterized repeat protein (TIGR02543 family)